MPEQIFYLQNSGNHNTFATIDGAPAAGVGVVSARFEGSSAQQWVAAAYPGTDLTSSDGVLFVLYYAGTAGTSNLVLTAGACGEPVTLQPFQQYAFTQLWTYAGPNLVPMSLSTGCVLELTWGIVPSGSIRTFVRISNNRNQMWTLVPAAGVEQAAREADEQAAREAGEQAAAAG